MFYFFDIISVRRDSFITHRAFCDALAEESARAITPNSLITNPMSSLPSNSHFMNMQQQQQQQQQQHMDNSLHAFPLKREQQNLINLPPWLSCPPMDTPHHINHHHNHHDLTSPSSSSSSIFIHQDQQHQNPSNPNMGPTFSIASSSRGEGIGGIIGSGPYNYNTQSPTSHMSATALLQKAAQMGATMSKTTAQQQQFQGHVTDNISNTNMTPNSTAGMFGLNLSSRDNQQELMSSSAISSGLIVTHALSSFGNKAATPTTTCGPGLGPNVNSGLGPSSTFLQDMITSYDNAFGIGGMAMMSGSTTMTNNNKKETRGGGGNGGVTRGNEGLTRDFLGMTEQLSHNDMLTIAEFRNSIATNTTTSHHQETHKTWRI